MATKKAQMFVVTAVFLATMMFVVQQIFITYAVLDVSAPFKTKEVYVIRGIIDSVNQTIKTTGSCQDFQRNLDELLGLLKDDVSAEGYLMDARYEINCTNWNTAYPGEAPLSLSLRLSETYDATGIIDFYHKQ